MPLNPTPPSAEFGMRNAESRRIIRSQRLATPIDRRAVHSALRTPHSALVSPNLLQLPGVRLVTVTQSEVSIQRRQPRPRALGPFDQHDGAVAHHVVEPQI